MSKEELNKPPTSCKFAEIVNKKLDTITNKAPTSCKFAEKVNRKLENKVYKDLKLQLENGTLFVLSVDNNGNFKAKKINKYER